MEEEENVVNKNNSCSGAASILTELYKWPVSGCIGQNEGQGQECLQNLTLRLAFVHEDIIFLITKDDKFFAVGRDTFSDRLPGDTENTSWIPKNIVALNFEQIIDIKIGSQKGPSSSSAGSLLSVVALSSTGTLYTWGNIAKTFTPTKVTFPAPSSDNESDESDTLITSFSIGGGHVLALSTESEIWAWGKNSSGQVGHTFKVTHSVPLKVPFRERHTFVSVSCGESHSVALTEGGHIYCWGNNDKGQLGIGTRDEYSVTPVLIRLPDGLHAKKVACGKRHTLGLSTTGELFAWGCNHHGELGIGIDGGKHGKNKSRRPVKVVLDPDAETDTPIADICTLNHDSISICKTTEGVRAVYMWGKVTEATGKKVDVPWKTLMNSITEVLSSFVHPAAMSTPLILNDYSNASPSNDPSAEAPVKVPNPKLLRNPGLKFILPEILSKLRLAFVCGSGFEQTAVIIDSSTDAVSFLGKNVHGSFGTSSEIIWETNQLSTPHEVLSGKGIISIKSALDPEGGCMCFFALTERGELYSWGYNEYGELGVGKTSTEPQAPQRITGGGIQHVKITQLATGSDHFLALSEDGIVFSWGYNMYGQLGTGNQEVECFSCVPKRIDFSIYGGGDSSTQISTLAAGCNHSIAVAGRVGDCSNIYVWGRNDNHQLGGAISGPYSGVPIRLKCNLDVKSVSCGPDFTLVLTISGNVYIWGSSSGLDYSKPTIIIVDDLSTEVIKICASHWASLAGFETKDGLIYLWGKVRGGKVLPGEPTPAKKSGILVSSVEDAVELYSSPWGCLKSIVINPH